MKGISVASLRDGRQSALPTVLVAHRPWPHAAAAAESNVQLQLSGQLIFAHRFRMCPNKIKPAKPRPVMHFNLIEEVGLAGWMGWWVQHAPSLYQEQTLNRPDC